ncbi:ATP-binding protein [Paenibacillus sp. MMS20-IR301]|uniref:sensor histidine kinase n=1 Tax=Paenibacillus sp. MMS20-IR301 TaxID=2895946 RepID=UPI0028E1F997|nr:ATP-binding protein [Paenibacillus sp. MMS20-IR301]WNS41497.1 ATP-binding protein [Paenibacillus sp. MMS20-IR301]
MRRRAILICLISLICCSLIPLSIVLNKDHGTQGIQAHGGVMDLASWNPEKNKRIKLDGEWEFYWNRLLLPADLKAANKPQPFIWINVPSPWNGKLVEGKPIPAFGSATYRIVLKNAPANGVYAIKKTNIRFSSAIFVNGHKLFEDGRPASNLAAYTPGNKPQIGYFTVDGDVEIIIQVANFDYVNGGIPVSLYFGEQSAMMEHQQKSVAREFSMLAILSTLAMVCLICYLVAAFYRKRDITLLLYSLICFLYALYHGLVGERPLLLFMPGVPFEVIYKFKDVLSILCFILLTFLFNQMSRSLVALKQAWLVTVVLGGFVMLSVILPIRTYTEFSTFIGVCYEALLVILLWRAAMFHIRGTAANGLKSLLLFLITLTLNLYSVDALLLGMSIKEDLILAQFYMVVFNLVVIFLIILWFFEAYNAMDKMHTRLIDLDRLKDDFLSTTSHELKTPLNAIVSITDTLLKGAEGPLTDNQNRNLAIVMGSGRRLTLLVNELLDYSKMKHGDLKLHPSSVDLRAVTDSVLRVHLFLLGGKAISFENRIPDDFPPVRADSNRLIQILHNLLSNAVQYSDSGTVSIEAEVRRGWATISVRDTGWGIPYHMLETIFEDFEQAVRPADQPSGGTGLGLSITRRLVELHGGTIYADSKSGQGSVIHFTLPLADPGDKRRSSTEHPWEKSLPQARAGLLNPVYPQVIAGDRDEWILVVDDDYANLQAMASLLSLAGYSIVAVHRGQLALDELTRRADFLLVILDIAMPDMAGYEVLERIRGHYSPFELPVLMLTARNKTSEIQLAMERGANDYVEKPFEAEELLARIQSLIQLKVAVKEARENEIAFLRAQINPHFLYNALNAIAELCVEEPLQAENLTLQLSHYLRASFDFKQLASLTTLEKELKLVKAYVYIEQARFGDRLKVDYDIQVDTAVLIPPLMLQPLVENAIRHGLMAGYRLGLVRLSAIRLENGELRFAIEDNGQGISPELLEDLQRADMDKKGVGLWNIRQRCKLLYGRELQIESIVGKGTRVWFDLPDQPSVH